MGDREFLEAPRLRGVRPGPPAHVGAGVFQRRRSLPESWLMNLVLPAALLLSISIGYLVAVLLLPISPKDRAGQLFAVCLGAGLGAGISSCLYFLVWLTLGPSTRTFVVLELVILGLLGAGFWARRVASASVAEPLARSVWWLPLIGFLAALAFA